MVVTSNCLILLLPEMSISLTVRSLHGWTSLSLFDNALVMHHSHRLLRHVAEEGYHVDEHFFAKL